jgi:Ca2+-transporting ATPase
MLAMLLAAGGVYLLLGDTVEAIILIVLAGFSIAITIVQEARTEDVLEALRDLAAPRALVIRDGATVRIPGRDVVEDDILVLEQGDRVSADALVLEAQDLQCDESLLTGESVPVRKRPAKEGESHSSEPGGEDRPYVYSGSIVTRGGGIACVTATGVRSRIGQIGRSLETLETESPRLKRETGRIVRLCAVGGLGVTFLVAILYGTLRGDWLDAALAAIAVGMSLLPEEFPVVLTIFLALGARRIAQVGALTRRSAAIETMGAATVLCTDKTGTLTQNKMTVSQLWLPTGEQLAAVDAAARSSFDRLLEVGALASAPVPVDPMEVAFHEAAGPANAQRRDDLTLVHSVGLRPELLAMSNLWEGHEDGGQLTVAAKGAPEAIAKLCRLDGDARAAMETAAHSLAVRGMRVLGVASAIADQADVAADHLAHDFTLLGLVGLSDPLRAGVAEAVAQCRAAGIRVVMITGDFAPTARAIASEAGIADGEIMMGEDVAALPDRELAERIERVTVFARTMPEQKLRIVTALKAAGEVVAMTGDGVNDAPALKAAHIGIAMGKRGTDVAREASAIVLVADDFGAIVAAIRVGRRVYDNLRKAVSFIFAVHVPIAGLAVLPLLLGSPLLFGPIQIALLEMIIDPVCAIVFEAEPEERSLMTRPPRRSAERLFSLPVVVRAMTQGATAFAVLAAMYLVANAMGMPAPELRALVFFALVAAMLALVLANRSFSTSVRHAFGHRNRAFRYVLAFIATATTLILTVPTIQAVLGFASLGLIELGVVLVIGVVLLLIFELTKFAGPRTL